MGLLLAASFALLPMVATLAVPVLSPFEHDGPELAVATTPFIVPGQAPIKHEAYFRGERELFGYSPRFMPGEAAFGPDDRPYIRTSFLQPTADGRTIAGAEATYIQTIGDDGRWVVHQIESIVQAVDAQFTGPVGHSVWASETRVVCDDSGDLYTIVTGNRKTWLLHLPAGASAWVALPVAGLSRATLDVAGEHPPLLVGQYGGHFIVPQKQADGTLSLSPPIRFGPDQAFLSPGHSGAGPVTARVDGITYLAYGLDQQQQDEQGKDIPGTPQYLVGYSHDTGQLGEPMLLGFGQNCYTPKADNHNGPVVLADSRGALHFITGAHQEQFWHSTSKVRHPRSPEDWTEPVALALRRRYDCGLTYTAAVFDSRDTLHLVTRNLSRGLDAEGRVLPPDQVNMRSMMRSLDYFRATRREDGSWAWEECGPLVIPLWHHGYSIFYHRLAIDSRDRLFLSYYSYAMQLNDEAIAAYRAKWPEEVGDGEVKPAAHDPVILVSEDHGETWRIAVTGDFGR